MEVDAVKSPLNLDSPLICLSGLRCADYSSRLQSLKHLKHSTIGSNRQKNVVLQEPQILQILLEQLDNAANTSDEILIETANVLGSLAQGSRNDVARLIAEKVVCRLLKSISNPCIPYVESCVRCLRSIFVTDLAPIEELYSDASYITELLNIVRQTPTIQACVADILSHSCLNETHQGMLRHGGAVESLAPLLCSRSKAIQLAALRCYAALCKHNASVSATVMKASYDGVVLLDYFLPLMRRDQTREMQVAAAKCITHLCRGGAISSSSSLITDKVMPTLVRGCKEDELNTPAVRADAAETLAYLTEEDADLQWLTSRNNQALTTLSRCLSYPAPDPATYPDMSRFQDEQHVTDNMQQAALKALASMASSDEEIRRKVASEVPGLLDIVYRGLAESNNPVMQVAAARCLHALSRSVEQLRTIFAEKSLWKALLQLARSNNQEVQMAVSAVLANLVLEFSPCRNAIIEEGNGIATFCALMQHENQKLRMNGVWALMNLAYKADHGTKARILAAIGPEQLLRLLADSERPVVLRILGLVRNMLTKPKHIDELMTKNGYHIMQVVTYVLEGNHPPDVKEEALCVLMNIADGESAKEFIVSNDDMMTKIASYLTHSNVRVQTAAAACVCNLVWKDHTGSLERQAKLKELGIVKLLQQLLGTDDPVLFEKAKLALHQFQGPVT